MLLKVLTLAVGFATAGLTVAEAMPIASVSEPSAAPVVKVDYACGRGFHLSRWGDCRPNWGGPPPRRYIYRDYGWRHRPPPPPWAHGWHRPPPRPWRDW
ncbi:GCG_CRPN prefix-to-repeats domain-containing protein [Oryzifoliimicrobium ureilyticus]|uniref:GCG_CRPN prefix-to-repeats domain-containing protein n=1 Tax=Oryzifoliimicrobium ureilyticus TaxID=3113724 RepID=UPI003076629A